MPGAFPKSRYQFTFPCVSAHHQELLLKKDEDREIAEAIASEVASYLVRGFSNRAVRDLRAEHECPLGSVLNADPWVHPQSF